MIVTPLQEHIISDSTHTDFSFSELFEHTHDSRDLDLPFIGHVHLPHFDPVHIGGMTIDFSITKHVVFLWVAALLLIVAVVAAAVRSDPRD